MLDVRVFAAEAVTVLQWSRISNRVGRKPILLYGLLGTIVSSLLFGLSRSLLALVFRCVRLLFKAHFTLTELGMPLLERTA